MKITNAVGVNTSIENLFPLVVAELKRLLHCERATMFVLTADRSKLFSIVQPHPVRENTQPIRIEVPVTNSSIAGDCVLNHRVVRQP